MTQSRSEMRNKKGEKKVKNRHSLTKKIGCGIGLFFTILLVLSGAFAWKVYNDVNNITDKMYKEVDKEEVRSKPLEIDNNEPFSVLLLGVDTGDLGRTEQGRSDTMMVVTVNPTTDQTTIVSIPRDTYTEIIGRGTMDKINHAYAFGGVSMAVNTVQNLLDIPIDYYIEANMQGVQDIVDALGGIEVTPEMSFDYESYSFVEGEAVTLDGDAALAYSRMRYEDPNGDYGRQARQRQIIVAAMNKVASLSTITNYKEVLETLEDNMQTNLTFDNLLKFYNEYRGAAADVEEVQLTGSGTTIDGIYYAIPDEAALAEITALLQEQLELN